MYYLATNNQGKVRKAIKCGRLGSPEEEEPKSPTDAEVQDWANQLTPRVDLTAEFPQGALLFFEADTLATFCGRHGVMLHVTGNNFTEGPTVNYGNQGWTSLKHAVAIRPEDEGPQNPAGITSDFSLLWVPRLLFESLSRIFEENRQDHPLWYVSSRPVLRAFVYLDVSDFSKYKPGQETLIINSLVRLVSDRELWTYPGPDYALDDLEAELCIGDGYIYVFSDARLATAFAGWMAELIQQMVALRSGMGPRALPVEFHFRIGVHWGFVYRFWDPGRQDWNYIGDGINGGNRVLSVIDKKYDDIVYVSDAVVSEFRRSSGHPGICANVWNSLESRGRQEDKHGKPWRVFLLNHSHLCGQEVRRVLDDLLSR